MDNAGIGIQGGNVLHGALMELVVCAGGEATLGVSRRWQGMRGLKVAQLGIMAVVGGTIAELGGGNFANGAMTATFAFLFNHLGHGWTRKEISYSDDGLGVVTAGKNGSAPGHYGVKYNLIIQKGSNNDLYIDVSGNAFSQGVPGEIKAVIVYEIIGDGKTLDNSQIQISTNVIYEKPPFGSYNYLGYSHILLDNYNQYKTLSISVSTQWLVRTVIGYSYPRQPLPILNLFVPLNFKYKYNIK